MSYESNLGSTKPILPETNQSSPRENQSSSRASRLSLIESQSIPRSSQSSPRRSQLLAQERTSLPYTSRLLSQESPKPRGKSSAFYEERPSPVQARSLSTGYKTQKRESVQRAEWDRENASRFPQRPQRSGTICIFYTYNFFYGIFGFIFLIYGIIYLTVDVEKNKVFDLFYPSSINPFIHIDYYLMILGGIMIITTPIGCLATYFEKMPLFQIYVAIMTVIMVCDLSIGIAAVVSKVKVETGMDKYLLGKLATSYGFDDIITVGFDLVQRKYKCCGVAGPGDYSVCDYTLKKKLQVAISCCATYDTIKTNPPLILDLIKCQNDSREIYQDYRYFDGCLPAVQSFFNRHSMPFIVIGFISCLFQMVGIATTRMVMKDLRY